MRAFLSGKGNVEVLGTKVKGECGEHRWNHLTFTCLCISVDKGFFHPFSLEAHHIGTLLGWRGFLFTL